jgi:hypothetical protein
VSTTSATAVVAGRPTNPGRQWWRAQGDEQEAAEVDLVDPLVERLVIGNPAEVEDVAEGQVRQVDKDREDAAAKASEGPAAIPRSGSLR